MTPFLDSSALVKRYVAEAGSATVRALLRRSHPVVARVTYAEVAAAIARASREGLIDLTHRDAILGRLDEDFARLTVIEIRAATLRLVPELVTRHPLRGYDAVQLAAALTVRSRGATVCFWSSDATLVTAARAEGLQGNVPGV
jgi:predicted nucleic acid-binding protein